MNYITFDIETYSDEPLAKIDTDKFKSQCLWSLS
jgi:hypothetical protein